MYHHLGREASEEQSQSEAPPDMPTEEEERDRVVEDRFSGFSDAALDKLRLECAQLEASLGISRGGMGDEVDENDDDDDDDTGACASEAGSSAGGERGSNSLRRRRTALDVANAA